MDNETQTEEERQARLNQRVELKIAVDDYLRAAAVYQDADKTFSEACEKLRSHLEPGECFVTEYRFENHVITVDDSGSFDVEKIERI